MIFIEFEPLCQKLLAFMSKLPKPLTKYGLPTSNSENFYFLPYSILNFRKVTKVGGNWPKNKKLQAKNKLGWK